MRLLKALALIVAVVCILALTAAPRPLGACTLIRENGPCTVYCISGTSCSGTQYCETDSCGTGIICDGRAYNCRI
jgi:hypothetical protein